jgi:hypothetical protein
MIPISPPFPVEPVFTLSPKLPLAPAMLNDQDREKLELNVNNLDSTCVIVIEKSDDDLKEEESRKTFDDVNGSVNIRGKEASR